MRLEWSTEPAVVATDRLAVGHACGMVDNREVGVSTPPVSRVTPIPAREVWPREEHDLTPWLAANLDVLEDHLGIGLELVEREHRIGRYELDLLLRAEDDRVVIVENQFGTSDHGHLGQLLAYAAGTEADVVVWLAEAFTEEHLAALSWLNESSDDGIGFFAVTLGAIRIDESAPAPVLETVARPSEWAKTIARERRKIHRDHDWDTYVSDAGHTPAKVAVARAIAEAVEARTEWAVKRTKNQITYRDNGVKVLALQLWSQRQDILLAVFGLDGAPEPNPLAPAVPRRTTKSGAWKWRIRSAEDVVAHIDEVIALVAHGDRSGFSSTGAD